MKLLSEKALVQSQDDGSLYEIDIIEHENQLWLVPHWYDVPGQAMTKPVRIIRLKSLRYQPPAAGQGYRISTPISTALLSPATLQQPIPGIEFQEMPDVSLPLVSKKAH